MLIEVDDDDNVFFGSLSTIPGASTATEMNTAEEDIITVTYDDVVTLVGDQEDRTALDDVINPWGDADDNEALQAFDAAQVLLDVLSGGTHLIGGGRLAADVADAFGAVTPFDAAFILKKRVGLTTTFPVQDPSSTNHPQGTPASKGLLQVRSLALQQGAYVYRAKNDDQMERLRTGLDLDLVVVCGRAEQGLAIQAFGMN